MSAKPADAHTCTHCDDPSHHASGDVRAVAEAYRSRLAIAAYVVLPAVALVWLLALAVVGDFPNSLQALLAALYGGIGWYAVSLVGLAAYTLLQNRRPAPQAALIGALLTAAVTPVLALVVAHFASAGPVLTGLGAGVGWMAPTAFVHARHARSLRALLTEDSKDAAGAREGLSRSGGRPYPLAQAAWLVLTSLMFGVYAALCALLPVLAVVLIPFNVAITIASRRLEHRGARGAVSPRA